VRSSLACLCSIVLDLHKEGGAETNADVAGSPSDRDTVVSQCGSMTVSAVNYCNIGNYYKHVVTQGTRAKAYDFKVLIQFQRHVKF